MTLAKRRKQLESRKNLIGCGVAGAMFIGALLFVNAMGSTGNEIAIVPETETEVVMTQPVEPETETEVILAAVDAPIVEEPSEWEEFETEEAEIEPNEVPTTTKKYTEDDVNRLAHLIWAEAGSAGTKAMEYTGSVCWNRVQSSLYPNSVKKVVAQKNQYGVAKVYMKKTPSDEAYAIALDICQNGSKLPSDYFLQAGSKTFKKYGNSKKYVKVGKIYFSALKN